MSSAQPGSMPETNTDEPPTVQASVTMSSTIFGALAGCSSG